MDLGLKGRTAIVSAASKGLGRACAMSLAGEGVNLVLNARSADALEETAQEIREKTGVDVTAVAADYNTEEGRAAILDACPEADILVSNPGMRQIPGDFTEWDKDEWLFWLNAHFLSSVQMIQAVVPGMRKRRFGRIVNISVSFIKFPQVNFAHSHAARLALSGAIASMVRECVPDNVTMNTVCPGFFDTDALHTNLPVVSPTPRNAAISSPTCAPIRPASSSDRTSSTTAASIRGCSEMAAPRIVMVSGGARGLGAAIVRRALADGHSVSVGVRRPEEVATAIPLTRRPRRTGWTRRSRATARWMPWSTTPAFSRWWTSPAARKAISTTSGRSTSRDRSA